MATYYVDGKSGNDSGNGSSERPWRTLNKAKNSISAGDEVCVRTATYHEVLSITTPNTTWRADSGHKPVLDGKWHDGLMSGGVMPTPVTGQLPSGGKYSNLITITANGVTIDGLEVRNSAGGGIGVGDADDVVVRNCRIDFSFSTSIRVNPGAGWADRVVIENNVTTRAAFGRLSPGETTWPGMINLTRMRDGIIRNNVLAYSQGEGLNIHRGSLRVTAEGNVIHDCRMLHVYIQRSSGIIIRNNLIYSSGTPAYLSSSGYALDGIIQGDEYESVAYPESVDNQIYNNIVINTGRLFTVRSNATASYKNSRFRQTYVGYNTFIGGPNTAEGIYISPAQPGYPHANNIFENNIIANIPGSRAVSVGSGNGILFRNNLWDRQPIASMRGSGDRIGNPGLVNASIKIDNVFPNPNGNVDPRNYQLTSTSNLSIGMASDGSPANGLTPPVIQKDFFGAMRDGKPDIGMHEYAGVAIELTANFSIGPGQATGQLPHTVDFIDKSVSSNPIVSHLWDFGDDETSIETNPSHTYNKAGVFDVSLTVTDNKGNTHTIKQSALISVTEVPNTVLPNAFRRFAITQPDGQKVLAYGTQYPDLRCILVWNDDPFHILNFDDIEDVNKRYVETGEHVLVWIDPGDQEEPPVEPSGLLLEPSIAMS